MRIGHYLKALFVLIAMLAMSLPVLCGIIYYDDPLTVGIGARPAAMGRAFTAISDDTNAMLINPAGLSALCSWTFSSMNSKFINEFNYNMLSGVFPTKHWIWGLSYVSSTIGQINLVEGGVITGSYDYYNSATVGTYATYIGNRLITLLGSEREIYGGMSVKYFTKGFSGDVIAGGTGFNMDAGIKYVQDESWAYGLVFQNFIIGGQIAGDFDPETVPFVTKLGVAYTLTDYDIVLALDKDMYIGRDTIPWPMHFGVEFSPNEILRLRAGLDQFAGSAVGGDISTNNTFGVGFSYLGFQADLAYVQNFAETNTSTTFLSLSYYGEDCRERARKCREEQGVYACILQRPAEEAAPAPSSAEAQVTAEAAAFEEAQEKEKEKALDAVEGYLGVKKYPYDVVRRKDAAVIIAKKNGYKLSETVKLPFRDVDPSMPEAKYIQACFENRVIVGYPDGTFRPEQAINSYELLSMMSDSVKGSEEKSMIKAYAGHRDMNTFIVYDEFVDAFVVNRFLPADDVPAK